MITLNCTNLEDVGGAFNIEENRKRTILEALNSNFFEDEVKVKIILHELLDEIIERGLFSTKYNILMQDNKLFNEIEKALDTWDINLLQL